MTYTVPLKHIPFQTHCNSSSTGHFFRLRRKHVRRVPLSIHYASVYSLQSAGQAQSVPAGYQTDTRHSRAGLWDTGWTTGGTGTGSCLRGTVPAHAETTERLHTSPPGDKTVQLFRIKVYVSFLMFQDHLTLNSMYLYRFLQSFEDCWNIAVCAIFLVALSTMCTCAFTAVTVQ
jgi:hypothetical protein